MVLVHGVARRDLELGLTVLVREGQELGLGATVRIMEYGLVEGVVAVKLITEYGVVTIMELVELGVMEMVRGHGELRAVREGQEL